MDDGAPALEVGFVIDTGGSFSELQQLQTMMDSTEMRVLQDAKNIERATSGMVNLAGSTSQINAFGKVSIEVLQATTREANRFEKQGERLVAQMERQNAAYGKTREELRALKVEEIAAGNARAGNTELAERLRAAEQAGWEQQFAIQRKARLEAEALAEDRDAAAARAVVDAARDAAAVRDAAIAHQQFEARVRQGVAAMREEELQARKTAAAVEAIQTQRLADEHTRLTAAVRGSQAAQEADAAAAERLRAATDPVYAATKRLNDMIAESARLYQVGATAPEEYARQISVLGARLRGETTELDRGAQGHLRHSEAVGLARNSQMELIHVLKASAEQAAMGASPFQILTTHLGQLGQIVAVTEGGVWGLTKALGGMLASVAPILLPLAAVAGVAFVAFKQFQAQVKDNGDLTRYRDSLGLTHKEMLQLSDGVDKAGDKIKHLSGVTVTAGDVIAGIGKTISDGIDFDGAGKKLMDALVAPGDLKVVENLVAEIYGVFTGGYAAIVEMWHGITGSISGSVGSASQAAAGFFKPIVESAKWVWQTVSAVFTSLRDTVVGWLGTIGGWVSPILKAVGATDAAQAVMAAGARIGQAAGKGYAAGVKQALGGMDQFGDQVGENARKHLEDRMKEQADAIKANRTPKKPHDDKHAEDLARDAAAVEAQIKNLYKLADAYGVSGAAALIAEAREKAESKAIKDRGDIEAAVGRELRLLIAQRVSDGEKSAAGLRDQSSLQEGVNAAVAAGLVPGERASELLKDRIALLPLQQALEAAVLNGQVGPAALAGKAIMDLAAAHERDNAARREAQYLTDKQAASDQLEQLRIEGQLIAANDSARVHALATLRATQEAQRFNPGDRSDYIAQQVQIADATERNRLAQNAYNDSLTFTADKWDIIAGKVQSAATGMADAFGSAGRAIGDLASIYASFTASRARADEEHTRALKAANGNETLKAQENARFALRSSGAQIEAYGDLAAAAKGFFKEGSTGYKALAAAEKVYRVAQLAMSLEAMIQMALETTAHVAGSAAQATADGTAGIAKQSQLPFPYNLAAMAATGAALIAAGIAVFGGHGGGNSAADFTKGNTGTGTVLGDPEAKSTSIKNAIDTLKSVDDATLSVSRDMLSSLRAIETNIGGLASLLVRTGNIDASDGIATGFKTNAIGSVLSNIPLIGGFLSSLFGSKTTVIGSGLYGGSQSIGDIMSGGYDLQTYSDIEKKKKFLGLTTSTKYSTQYGQADSSIDDQFTLVLKSFYSAIDKAAPQLGQATSDVEQRLNDFVFTVGKIDLQGKTGAEIQEQLENILGAAADNMAQAAVPGLDRFQKVGEGYFETLVRVATTTEQVDAVFNRLGVTTTSLGIDVDMAVAGMFDSVSDFTSLAGTYFSEYYTKAEQAAAQTTQISKALDGLGLALPDTLAGYRALVDAQDLTTDAGRQTYVTLLQLAPAFSDLKTSMEGAKSAADILSEQQDLQAKILQLTGDTAAIRAAELAKLDPSNRALQEQIYSIQDAQDAAKAASDLASAWSTVGTSIMDEVNRIRGLTSAASGGSYAQLLGQFNAATSGARAGDQDLAKSLPGLSQALLTAAAAAATSRQELDRVQAQTAASLEATYGVVMALTGAGSTSPTPLDAAATASAAAGGSTTANDNAATEIASLRTEMADMSTKLVAALATIAASTGRTAKKLDDVTGQSGGDAIAIVAAAA